jgi:ADP-ribose pyrophosphatase YjhB (NUDIX family)/nicotinamidase-related amidase
MWTVERLFGWWEHYGSGPLAQFLGVAKKVHTTQDRVHTIFLRDLHDPNDPNQAWELARYGNHNIWWTEWAEFIDLWSWDITEWWIILNTSTLSMPTKWFYDAFMKITGKDFMQLSKRERDEYVFVLCWLYTDIRVKDTAAKIRNDFEFPNVITSPDLVWSRDNRAHLRTLQVDMPNSLVTVYASLRRIWEIAGLPVNNNETLFINSDTFFLPEDTRNALTQNEKEVLQSIFIEYAQVTLKQLWWWFSGSKLFLAHGALRQWGEAQPVIVKIDKEVALYRESSWYEKVKEYLWNNIPWIELIVSHRGTAGARISIATMEWDPVVLQKIFETTSKEWDFKERFLTRLELALDTLGTKLYKNRQKKWKWHLYRELWVHTDEQEGFLRQNIKQITGTNWWEIIVWSQKFNLEDMVDRFGKIVRNVDRLDVDFTTAHGDLNLANIISDNHWNIWLIDWTHAGERLLELDYAKLENDIKYVLSKEITMDDISTIHLFEGFLIQNISLPEIGRLPSELQAIISQDFRFYKIYTAVKMIRDAYLRTRIHTDDIIYRATLLRYATHTLSFNKEIGRGECEKSQLYYALLWTTLILDELEKDPLHSFSSSWKSEWYPERSIVPKEMRDWSMKFDDYKPVYCDTNEERPNNPLHQKNPHWRTGVEGRWSLYFWWINTTVDPVILRKNTFTQKLQVLLVKRKHSRFWELPWTFQHTGEDIQTAIERWLKEKIWIKIGQPFSVLRQLYVADDRNTDDAWIETVPWHILISPQESSKFKFSLGKSVEDVAWIDTDSTILHSMYANHADIIRMTTLSI